MGILENFSKIFNLSLVYATFRASTPIIYAALCAAITQQANILNIGTEGIMLVGSPAGCDSRVWRNIAGCNTIQFGPDSLEQCHGIDEWVSIEDYLNCILVYANLILEFCQNNNSSES